MALNSFSVVLFVPPATEVFAEKKIIYTAFCPLVAQLHTVKIFRNIYFNRKGDEIYGFLITNVLVYFTVKILVKFEYSLISNFF